MFLHNAVNFASAQIPVLLRAPHIRKHSGQIGFYILIRGRQSVHKFTHWQCMPPCTLHEVVHTGCQFTHLLLPQQKKRHTGILYENASLCLIGAICHTHSLRLEWNAHVTPQNFPVGNNVGKHSTSKCFNLLLNASSFTFISL